MEPKNIKASVGAVLFLSGITMMAVGSRGDAVQPAGDALEVLTKEQQDTKAEKVAAREKLATVTEPALTKEALAEQERAAAKQDPGKFSRNYNEAILPLVHRDPSLADMLTVVMAPGDQTDPETFGRNFPLGARLQVDAENHLWVEWPSGDAMSITGGSCTDKPDEQQTWCGFTVVNDTDAARRAVFLVRYSVPE